MTGNVWRADNGDIYMNRCPRCERENYALAVSSGVCSWCGERATEKHLRQQENNDWPARDWLPIDKPGATPRDNLPPESPAGEIHLPRN